MHVVNRDDANAAVHGTQQYVLFLALVRFAKFVHCEQPSLQNFLHQILSLHVVPEVRAS